MLLTTERPAAINAENLRSLVYRKRDGFVNLLRRTIV